MANSRKKNSSELEFKAALTNYLMSMNRSEVDRFAARNKISDLLQENNQLNINTKIEKGYTLLHVAALDRDKDIQFVEEILNRNPDVNAKDNDNNTPLFLSFITPPMNKQKSGDVILIAKALVSKGANKTIENANGQTPLDIGEYFCKKYDIDVVDVLGDRNKATHKKKVPKQPGVRKLIDSEGLSPEKLALIKDLSTYTNRIEGRAKPEEKIDFKKGFRFFKGRRSRSRENNYITAKELIAALMAPNSDISHIFSKENIKSIRKHNGGIHSKELNEIIHNVQLQFVAKPHNRR